MFAIVGLVFGLDCCVVVLCNCVVSGISFSFVVFVSCGYVVWFDLLCFAWWFRWHDGFGLMWLFAGLVTCVWVGICMLVCGC